MLNRERAHIAYIQQKLITAVVINPKTAVRKSDITTLLYSVPCLSCPLPNRWRLHQLEVFNKFATIYLILFYRILKFINYKQ